MLLLLTFGGGFILYLYYLMDQQGFNRNMYNVYFTSLNTYHRFAIKLEEVFEYYNNLAIEDQRNSNVETNIVVTAEDNTEVNENEITYSYEPYKTQQSLSYYNYIPNINMIETSKNPILFLKSYVDDDYKYLQFNDISLNLNKFLPIKPIDKGLFIQVEFIYKGKTYDISLNSIKPFLVNNNYIFNKKFVKWFIQQEFNVLVEDNYTIKIIDETINMFELDDTEYIYLENDTYVVDKSTNKDK